MVTKRRVSRTERSQRVIRLAGKVAIATATAGRAGSEPIRRKEFASWYLRHQQSTGLFAQRDTQFSAQAALRNGLNSETAQPNKAEPC